MISWRNHASIRVASRILARACMSARAPQWQDGMMTPDKLSDNQIALLMHLEDGELDDYDFKMLPDELREAFHELWSVNSKQGHDHVEIRHCGGCECGACNGEGAFYSINDNGRAALRLYRDDDDKQTYDTSAGYC